MTMFLRVLSAILLLGVACAHPEPKTEEAALNKFFLADSTRLSLPKGFVQSASRDSIFDFIEKALPQNSTRQYFFTDTSRRTSLAVFKVPPVRFNQNTATQIHNHWYNYFVRMTHTPCRQYTGKGASQYSSNRWNAIKIKFLSLPASGCPLPQYDRYITVFYFQSNDKAYYFVQTSSDAADLSAALQQIVF